MLLYDGRDEGFQSQMVGNKEWKDLNPIPGLMQEAFEVGNDSVVVGYYVGTRDWGEGDGTHRENINSFP